MTKDGRINIRIEPSLLQQVKEIAKRRGVTVTHLIDQNFRELVDQEHRLKTEEELGVEQA